MRGEHSPIIIGGIGRSGSTLLQWALSQHPDIHIYGQVNTFDFGLVHDAARRTEKAVHDNHVSNTKGHYPSYPFSHYAGSDAVTVRMAFAEALRLSICGPEPPKRRWGFKYIHTVRSAFDYFWPNAQWVVCVREPLATFESCRNAFPHPSQTVDKWFNVWMRVPKFMDEHPQAFVWQVDKLRAAKPEQRRAEAGRLLDYLGEPQHSAVLDYIEKLPTVHKWVPAGARGYRMSTGEVQRALDATPGLWGAVCRLGYAPVVKARLERGDARAR